MFAAPNGTTLLVLLEMAAARLYSAGNSRSSMMAAQDTGMAADCLHAALVYSTSVTRRKR